MIFNIFSKANDFKFAAGPMLDIDSQEIGTIGAAQALRTQMLIPILEAGQYYNSFDGVRNRRGNKLKVMPHCIAAPKAQAIVQLHRHVHHVGLHSGLLLSSFCVANSLFQRTALFCDMGVPNETRNKDRIDDIYKVTQFASNLDWHSDTDILKLRELVPEHEIQAFRAFGLYNFIIQFACLHELAHAMLGHCHFVDELLGMATIEDGRDAEKPGFENWNLVQLLEVEADLDAIFAMFETVMQILKVKDVDSNEYVRFAAIGAFLCIWLTSSGRELDELNVDPDRTHPFAALRQTNIMHAYKSLALRYAELADAKDDVDNDLQQLCETSYGFSQFLSTVFMFDESLKMAQASTEMAIAKNLEELKRLGKFRYVESKLGKGYDGL